MDTTLNSYNKTALDYISTTKARHPLHFAKIFTKHLSIGSSILDIGCAGGRDAKIFSSQGYKVVGIDPSEKMIDAARLKHPELEFKVMDARTLDFPDNYFNGLWANAVYLHLPKIQIRGALSEARRVLKNKGVFYMSFKYGSGGGIEKDARYGYVDKYWSYYNKDEITEHLISQGFIISMIEVDEKISSYGTHLWIRIICEKK